MRSIARAAIVVLVLSLSIAGTIRASGDEPAAKHQASVDKGLEYLVKQQNADGYWSAANDQFKVPLTALSGMNLLMQGSTTSEGKYSAQLVKAVDWLVARSQKDGLIGDTGKGPDSARAMYGHGFSILFLSSVYQQEKDAERRKKLEDVLTRAVAYTAEAQTKAGGWGYVAAKEGNDFDEGSTTITQVQSLRAARLAGIAVPKEVSEKSEAYLKQSTTDNGGVIYSLQGGGKIERPTLTIGALASLYGPREYAAPLAAKWLKFAQSHLPSDKLASETLGFWDYTHYYFAQALYGLGDDGYARLFPDTKPDEQLAWSKYRSAIFDAIVAKQADDGSWPGNGVGPIFTTNCLLTILQLDKAALPIYRR